jgi:exodeoxyribonuclease VII large subunit
MSADPTDPLQDQLGFSFTAAPQRRVWTPRELMEALRTVLEREFSDVWVEGEISNYRPAESGHIYLTLKDADAQVRLVMFRNQSRLLRFRPENGMQVIARGRLSLYEARGDLQLYCEYLEPKGAGALQVAFEQLKAKLAAEGLFDVARKKPLPTLPRRIGIVTSPRGAAVQDFLNIIRRRHESVAVLIYPAQVQGESAAAEVAAGVRWFSHAKKEHAVDVIVVARGGGSLEDLAAFNDEALARAIAASKIPVISAVGHETDFTIADFVADLRAPTPSAAAEIVVEAKHILEERIASLQSHLAKAARYRIIMARSALNELAQHQVFARMSDLLARRQQRIDDLAYRLVAAHRSALQSARQRLEVAGAKLGSFDLRRRLATMRSELSGREHALASALRQFTLHRRSHLDTLAAQIEQLSPVKILERGYALVFDAAGKLVKDPARLHDGDAIRARVARGEFAAVVKKPS